MKKKPEIKKLAVRNQVNSPADVIRMATSGGADLDKLEKLLALQEKWEANEAKKAYYKAMAAFKANPPKIDKDKTVSYNTSAGKTSYKHASLANVTEKISAELSKYGLSASWVTKQNGQILVTCKIAHELGHSEETTICAPSDTSGSKNAIQAIGSTITYLERYTLLALTGLATYDQDDDAIAAGKPIVQQPVERPKTLAPIESLKTTELREPKSDDFVCNGCGIAITKSEQEYSLKKFEESLCRNCQRDKLKRG